MKRRDLEKHLHEHGCELHHHGGRHDIWLNTRSLKQTSIPRHTEIKRGTIKSICEKLGVPSPI
ncbi:MAG: type II toxin-antitoxin system HicA family toxin [Planctomycetes bacterium]|nr:type II toxin-antitoxin system HicA family toxin [Planctomycetota bacterium]